MLDERMTKPHWPQPERSTPVTRHAWSARCKSRRTRPRCWPCCARWNQRTNCHYAGVRSRAGQSTTVSPGCSWSTRIESTTRPSARAGHVSSPHLRATASRCGTPTAPVLLLSYAVTRPRYPPRVSAPTAPTLSRRRRTILRVYGTPMAPVLLLSCAVTRPPYPPQISARTVPVSPPHQPMERHACGM